MSSFPPPPNSTLYPLLSLEAFLGSLETSRGASISNSEGNTNNGENIEAAKKIQAKRKLILRVAECLFGSILEGAMTILDSYFVTEVIAVQSRRRMFVLANAASRRGPKKQQEEPNTYFCLVPDSLSNCDQKAPGGFHFCSCRSYFERTKTLGAEGTEPHSLTVCKHLLALKLRPHLQDNCKVIETVTEVQFSQEIVKRLFGGRA